jgi:hypothetical protein
MVGSVGLVIKEIRLRRRQLKPLVRLAISVCVSVIVSSVALDAAEPTLGAVQESIRTLISENKAEVGLEPIHSFSASGCHVKIDTRFHSRFGPMIRTYRFDLADIEEIIIYVDTGVELWGGIEEKLDETLFSRDATLFMHFGLKTEAKKKEMARTVAYAFAQARELCTGEHKDPVAKP